MSPLSDFGKADLEERDCYEEKKNIQHVGEMPCGCLLYTSLSARLGTDNEPPVGCLGKYMI